MVTCNVCNECTVHPACYGLGNTAIDAKTWTCNPCAAEIIKPKCEICGSYSGAMVATQKPKNGWAHVFCARLSPATVIDAKTGQVSGIDNIPNGFFKLECSICKIRRGICVQCSSKRCVVSFHPLCAKAEGFQCASRSILCREHTKEETSAVASAVALMNLAQLTHEPTRAEREQVMVSLCAAVGKFLARDIEYALYLAYGKDKQAYSLKAQHLVVVLNREELCRAVQKGMISARDVVGLKD